MDIKDIGNDVAGGDLRAIERAYRAIVGYPHEEEIDGANVASLYAALSEVCGTLTDDQNVMPSATSVSAGLPPGSTYADGAADFRKHPGPWMQRVQTALGGH